MNKIRIVMIISILTGIVCCQDDEQISNNLITDAENRPNSSHFKSTVSEVVYLVDLIDMIETMSDEGLFNKGIAHSLIVKIENAIKSLQKSGTYLAFNVTKSSASTKVNDNSFKGQMNALLRQLEALVENGKIPPEQGQQLINHAESAIILSDGSFIDPRDGNEYSVVLIGDQLWMAENLKATKYNDGTGIPLVENKAEWDALSTPGYCWYNNDYETYGAIYGALYNWYAAGTGKLSPIGWHVPTDEEWSVLITYLGGEEVAGGKLKETGTDHWLSPNEGATNESGFTALPADARYYLGDYHFLGVYAHWWTSSEFDLNNAWLYYVMNDYGGVARITPNKRYGVSIRCIKD